MCFQIVIQLFLFQVVQAHPTDVELKEELGSGTCGQVYNAYHKKTGQTMAVKVMHWSGNSEDKKRILMDLDVVSKSLDCPFIVRCFGTFITEVTVLDGSINCHVTHFLLPYDSLGSFVCAKDCQF